MMDLRKGRMMDLRKGALRTSESKLRPYQSIAARGHSVAIAPTALVAYQARKGFSAYVPRATGSDSGKLNGNCGVCFPVLFDSESDRG